MILSLMRRPLPREETDPFDFATRITVALGTLGNETPTGALEDE